VIGPSLQSCCAEFKNWQSELGVMAEKFEKKPLHFSLTEIAFEKLKSLGLLEKNIHIDNSCTCCSYTNKADYYSFRQNRGSFSGRHISAITYLKEPQHQL
jgi:copper oxidase (laccase) domain-containing protein